MHTYNRNDATSPTKLKEILAPRRNYSDNQLLAMSFATMHQRPQAWEGGATRERSSFSVMKSLIVRSPNKFNPTTILLKPKVNIHVDVLRHLGTI